MNERVFNYKEVVALVKHIKGLDITNEEIRDAEIKFPRPRSIKALIDYPFKNDFTAYIEDLPSEIKRHIDWVIDSGYDYDKLTLKDILSFMKDDEVCDPNFHERELEVLKAKIWMINNQFGSVSLVFYK